MAKKAPTKKTEPATEAATKKPTTRARTAKAPAATNERAEVAKAPKDAAAVIAEPGKLAQEDAASPTPAQAGTPERRIEPVIPSAPTKGREPTYEEIARRAYELYVARGGRHGGHVDDWLQAERELRQGT